MQVTQLKPMDKYDVSYMHVIKGKNNPLTFIIIEGRGGLLKLWARTWKIGRKISKEEGVESSFLYYWCCSYYFAYNKGFLF